MYGHDGPSTDWRHLEKPPSTHMAAVGGLPGFRRLPGSDQATLRAWFAIVSAAAARAPESATATTGDVEERYCVPGCTDPGGDMVGCDTDGCATGGGWFHLTCVGLQATPDETKQWHCPTCAAPEAATAATTRAMLVTRRSHPLLPPLGRHRLEVTVWAWLLSCVEWRRARWMLPGRRCQRRPS